MNERDTGARPPDAFTLPAWLRSLNAQLFLWAVLPITFVIIAFAFSGVYAHQRTMRDLVLRQNLITAQLLARIVEDGLASGIIGVDGSGLQLWFPRIGPSRPITVAVIGRDARILAHSDVALVGGDSTGQPGVAEALRFHEGFAVVPSPGDETYLVAFAPVPDTGWQVIVREPLEGLIEPILRVPSVVPVVALSAGILSVLILTFGWRTIVRPLQQLSQAAGQVSWGDYSAIEEPIGGVQEVRDLRQALGDMVARIRSYEAGMRDYVGAVTRGQEEERARLARELHDGPVQEAIAAGQRTEMAHRLLERGERQRAMELLSELRDAEQHTVNELRRLIGGLRPVYLEDLGFLPALEMLVRQMSQQGNVRIEMAREGESRRLPPEIELVAYRIAQEALSNAVQHARATAITLRIRFRPQELFLSVSDDGAGFALPPRPDSLTRLGHFGIIGMQERAALLGGSLEIDTEPGAGTRVIARLPTQLPSAPIGVP